MGNSKTIAVETETLGTITVHKMALGDYAELLRALNKLPSMMGDIIKRDKSELTTELILQELPEILANALPEVAGVVAAATDKDKEEIVTLDLAEFMEVTDAALQLNDVERIVTAVKKMAARFRKPALEQTAAPQA